MRSILDEVALGSTHWAEVHDPAIVEGDHCLEQEVCVAAGCMLVQMHVTNWAKAPKKGPDVEYSVGLAESTEEDRFEDTSGRICLKQRRPADLMELAEFYDSSGSPIPMLNAQR